MKREVKKIYKNFLDALKTPELMILPGQLAFYILMSIIPIIAIISLVASYLINNFDLYKTISSIVPDVLASTIIRLIDNTTIGNVAFIIMCYIILGSNGPSAIIISSNEIYGLKQPNFIKLKIKACLMTMIIVLLFLFIIIIPLLGNIILKNISYYFPMAGSIKNYYPVITILKYLGSFLVIYMGIKLLYTLGPNKTIKSKHTTLGSIFTTLGFIITTELFAFYISNIARYDKLYGNFANILILLIWIYLLAYIFVVGMAINVNRYQNKECQNEKEKNNKSKK